MSKRKADKREKLSDEFYEAEIEKLHTELVKLQRWVVATGARIIVVFEGRDAAGKGGVIKRITERVSPRVFRVVALPAPSEKEKTQMYMQRYIKHFPSAGEVVLFDRSWYNRAGVERVMNFATKEQVMHFLQQVPNTERAIVDEGIQLIKYWFDVSMEEQEKRFMARINDPQKVWKLTSMDLESYRRWYDYSRARDEMFLASDRKSAPWYIVPADDKKRARLNCISHLLSLIEYEDIPHDEIDLGERDFSDEYDDRSVLDDLHIVPRLY